LRLVVRFLTRLAEQRGRAGGRAFERGAVAGRGSVGLLPSGEPGICKKRAVAGRSSPRSAPGAVAISFFHFWAVPERPGRPPALSGPGCPCLPPCRAASSGCPPRCFKPGGGVGTAPHALPCAATRRALGLPPLPLVPFFSRADSERCPVKITLPTLGLRRPGVAPTAFHARSAGAVVEPASGEPVPDRSARSLNPSKRTCCYTVPQRRPSSLCFGWVFWEPRLVAAQRLCGKTCPRSSHGRHLNPVSPRGSL